MEKIIKYLVDELGQAGPVAKRNAKKLYQVEEVKKEFEAYMSTREYPENGISVNGYNAKKISELAPFMNECGVYNFMVTLETDFEKAKSIIDEGFKLK